jgi:hypothetical protein
MSKDPSEMPESGMVVLKTDKEMRAFLTGFGTGICCLGTGMSPKAAHNLLKVIGWALSCKEEFNDDMRFAAEEIARYSGGTIEQTEH